MLWRLKILEKNEIKDKCKLNEFTAEDKTLLEDVIDDLIRGNNIEELLGLAPETIYEDEYNKYLNICIKKEQITKLEEEKPVLIEETDLYESKYKENY